MSEHTATRDAVTIALFASAAGAIVAWLVLSLALHAAKALPIAAVCFLASFAINLGINLYRLRRRAADE